MSDIIRSTHEDMVAPEDDFPIVDIYDVVTSDASLDPLAGGTAGTKPIWTPEQIAAYLNRSGGQYGEGPNDLSTRSGDPTVITYGFHENQQSLFDNGYVYARNGQLFAFSEYFQFGAFTEAQRAATREAMQNWDDVIAVTFQETSAYQGDINFGNLTNSPNTQAYSRIPTASYDVGGANANFYGNQIAGLAGDVWVSTAQASNFQFDEGLYGLNTLVHEVGHSLGLSHPGNYNFGPGFAVNYVNGAEYAQDARNYSIMSYWNPRDMANAGVPTRDFDWSLMNIAYGSTPMIHDILAAQNMYGADMTTRTGDTTYGFNSNAGRDHFDFDATPWPTMTIWDAGGVDTLDASGYNVQQMIDLTPGSLSSIGGVTYEEALAELSFAQVNANRAAAGYGPVSQATYDANMAAFAAQPDYRGRLTDNVGIAYGATIENAKGGGGNDVIFGNTVNNELHGNGGNDVLEGRGGNDTLFGGLGADQLYGGEGNDRLAGGDGVDFMTGGAGVDTFVAEINASKTASKSGPISLDVITDFQAGDLIDILGSFTFKGTSANKNAGDVTIKVYTSVNGAENALGFDIDGIDGPSTYTGPVTIVFGNTDGGAPDFALALLNTNGLDASAFV